MLKKHSVIVVKSTVPVGTYAKIKSLISENTEIDFDVVSNPEFLREGSAVCDFFHPDRIVIGSDSCRAIDIVRKLHSFFDGKGIPL